MCRSSRGWPERAATESIAASASCRKPLANTPGIRHIAFAVEDIEAIVAKLKKKGVEFFSEIQDYEGSYKLCLCRGPEGIILELDEQIK